MNISTRFGGIGLVAVLLLPMAAQAALQDTQPDPSPRTTTGWLARGGGGGRIGGGGGGGGGRIGGGSLRSGGGGVRSGGQTGFQNAGSGLNRGDRRPSGGWSNNLQAGAARPSLERPAGRDSNRPALTGSTGNRSDFDRSNLSRGDLNRNVNINRDVNRDFNRTVNRNWSRNVNIGNVNVHPGWARPGWGVARPWNTGWYGGWNNPPWGWWGARAAVWGIGTLATASLINSTVDAAINNQVSYIVVPNTTYQLLYGSVAPIGNSSVSFAVTADGNTYELTADCRSGIINGQDPASAAEAELLNAACQVAFGSS